MADKRCPRCRETLSVEQFYHDYGRADTYAPYCKTCSRQLSKARYERKKEHMHTLQKQWRANNREHINSYQRRWRLRKAISTAISQVQNNKENEQ